MNKVWLKGFSEIEEKEFKAACKSFEGRLLVETLARIVEDDIKTINKQMCTDSFSGDWAYEQAVLVSQLKNSYRILELLNSLLTKEK